MPLSIGDGILGETADAVVTVPEVFNYWLEPGRIEVGFLGATQIDRYANINTTVIGADYDHPEVRLPGAGGAPEIAAACREVIVVLRHSARAFVQRVDFVTSVVCEPARVITDLGALTLRDGELALTEIHPGVEVDTVPEATAWGLRVADDLATTPPPTADELAALRELTA